jgi:hypothetical protein
MGAPAANVDNTATSGTTRFIELDPLALALCASAGSHARDDPMLEELTTSLGLRLTGAPTPGCLSAQAALP